MREKLLTTREVSQVLNISEKDVIELTKIGKIPYFKVAGEFLRFRKDDIYTLKKDIQSKYNIYHERSPFVQRIKEFFYFNDFYIVSSLIIVVLLVIILKG